MKWKIKHNNKKNKSNDNRPYTIRILPNNECFLWSWARYCLDSKADQVIKFSEAEEYFKKYLKDIREKKREVPKILKIKLEAHGESDGSIFMGNKKATNNNQMYYTLGSHIKDLLTMGVKKVYIKTSPCDGGCYVNTREGKRSVFQIIKSAIERPYYDEGFSGLYVLDKEKAEELINKVYCSTTRAGIGIWNHARVHGHAHGYCQEKDVPWYKTLRYELNDFLGVYYWTFVRWKPSRCVNWFRHMSEPKRKSMGVLIGSEGKIYFPLTDADKFGYYNYFKNENKAELRKVREELHETYSGPDAKEDAYRFLGLINNKEAKNNSKNEKKHDYASCCLF